MADSTLMTVLATVYTLHVTCQDLDITQVACHQLLMSPCSVTLKWDGICAPVAHKVSPKAKRSDYRSLKVGKFTVNVKKHEDPVSWDAALAVCQSEGGSLVKIDTKEKQEAITGHIAMKTPYFRSGYLWLGLRDVKRNNTFVWTDNTPLLYKDWGVNEPSHIFIEDGKQRDEDCVVTSSNAIFGIYWNDCNCRRKYGFICEIY